MAQQIFFTALVIPGSTPGNNGPCYCTVHKAPGFESRQYFVESGSRYVEDQILCFYDLKQKMCVRILLWNLKYLVRSGSECRRLEKSDPDPNADVLKSRIRIRWKKRSKSTPFYVRQVLHQVINLGKEQKQLHNSQQIIKLSSTRRKSKLRYDVNILI